ncbi:MAG: Flp family type IVb pilin [Alphaproteobacteria bacterium]|nr:Flp family type IVb pilin [Alphaproteobacteria bacterium]
MFLDHFIKKKGKRWSIGATAVEYTLIASLITTLLVVGYKRVGNGYKRIYNNIAHALP